MLQPGREIARDLLGQRFDWLARVEDPPALRLLRYQLLVARRDLLMIRQLARVEPIPLYRVGASRRCGQRARWQLRFGLLSSPDRPVARSLAIALALEALALQPFLGS